MSNMISKLAMASLLAGALTAPSRAQTGNLKVDSDHSDARFSIDVTKNKPNETITMGTARVTGTLNLDQNDLTQSTFAFNLYPATSTSAAIDQYGKSASGNDADPANYTLVSFQSERVSSTSDGKLLVSGRLLLTRVDRIADYTPNEAYAGPVYYGAPIIHSVAREASFVISFPGPFGAQREGNQEIEASATGVIFREDFPQLLDAVVETNWPAMVQDEKCAMPPTTGEDYAGASCTGKVVQVPSFPAIYTEIGEDYSGAHAPVQLGNNLTVLVHMQLTGENGQLSAKAGQ